MRSRFLVVVALVSALSFTAAAPEAHADYRASFKRGFQAWEKGQWQEAVRWLRQAVEENPRAGGKPILIYGRRYEDYLPHFFLGDALYQSGDLKGAATALRTSRDQGEVLGSPHASRLRESLAQIERKLAAEFPSEDLDEIIGNTRRALEAARRLESDLHGRQGDPAYQAVFDGAPELTERLAAASRGLKSAQEQFQAAERSQRRDALLASSDLVNAARRELDRLAADVTARQTLLAEEESQRQELQELGRQRALVEAIEGHKSGASPLLQQPAADLSPELQNERRALQQLLETPSPTPGKGVSTAELERREAALAAAIADYRRALRDHTSAQTQARQVDLERQRELIEAIESLRLWASNLLRDAPNDLPPDLVRQRRTLERLVAQPWPEPRQDVALAELEAREDNLEASIAEYRQGLDRWFSEREASEEADLEEAQRADLVDSVETIPGPPSGGGASVPDALLEAAGAYFAGEYDRVVSLLSASEFPDSRGELQRNLFIAAASLARYYLGGETDEELLGAALRHVAICRELEPSFAPDPEAFSPRLLDLFSAGPG